MEDRCDCNEHDQSVINTETIKGIELGRNLESTTNTKLLIISVLWNT